MADTGTQRTLIGERILDGWRQIEQLTGRQGFPPPAIVDRVAYLEEQDARRRNAGSRHRPRLGDNDVDDLLISATRYALGRATYIVSWTVGLILAHEPWLSDRARTVLLRDIDHAFELGATGMDMDAKEWARARTALRPDGPADA